MIYKERENCCKTITLDYLGLPWITLDYLGLPWLTFDLPSTSSCEAVMYEAYYTSKEVCLCPKKTLRRLTAVSLPSRYIYL